MKQIHHRLDAVTPMMANGQRGGLTEYLRHRVELRHRDVVVGLGVRVCVRASQTERRCWPDIDAHLDTTRESARAVEVARGPAERVGCRIDGAREIERGE